MIIYCDGSLTRTCILPDPGTPIIVPFTGTVNEAEYEALQRSLEYALDFPPQSVVVYMDSQLVVRQMNGQYAVRNKELEHRWKECQHLWAELKSRAGGESIEIKWNPREQNKAGFVLG